MKLPDIEQRAAELKTRQRRKMARSAHAYVRGSTAQFYDWLESSDSKALPVGPPVWICGDCHVGNLGPVANAKGKVAIQIRDLDQTVIGNPAHDLVRLALSLASAARGSNLPGAATAQMVEQVVAGYAAALSSPREDEHDEQPDVVRSALKAAVKRDWRQLATEHIDDPRPQIPLGGKFWPLDENERAVLAGLVKTREVAALATALHSRADDAEIELLDAAYWVKGCSSLGRLRYALLLAVGEGKHRQLSLIDVKEAVKPAAPRLDGAKMPRDNGQRVVEGARNLSAYLGDRMAAARILDRSVFVRELLPQDLKLEIETLSEEEARTAARFLAGVVGRAHARQMDEADRDRWSAELERNRSKGLDAPSWLWSSVVELMGLHEAAYLEHCRRHAQLAA